jgi:hypothetical protein
MADNRDDRALNMLKQIDSKLDSVLEKLSIFASEASPLGVRSAGPRSARRSERARQVAAMTPAAIRQTDSVELLHQDRAR